MTTAPCPRCSALVVQRPPFGGAVCDRCHRAEEAQMLALATYRRPYTPAPTPTTEGTP